jgi:hypothetical protein
MDNKLIFYTQTKQFLNCFQQTYAALDNMMKSKYNITVSLLTSKSDQWQFVSSLPPILYFVLMSQMITAVSDVYVYMVPWSSFNSDKHFHAMTYIFALITSINNDPLL